MGDNDYGSTLAQLDNRLMNAALGVCVKRTGGFIQNQDLRIAEDGAGNGEPLALPAGEFYAAIANKGVIAVRQRENKFMRTSFLRRGDNLLVRRRTLCTLLTNLAFIMRV